jgi:hypothetical protein
MAASGFSDIEDAEQEVVHYAEPEPEYDDMPQEPLPSMPSPAFMQYMSAAQLASNSWSQS